jgi:hypothetical protein
MEKTIARKIPILDLNESAFHILHGDIPEVGMQGTRVSFLFTPNDKFFDLSARYNGDEAVPVLSFVSCIRHLRAKLYAARANGGAKHE